MTYLQKLLIADGAFVAPAHVLEHLSAAQAKARPAGAPHGLYEELWHTEFWQHLTLSVIHGEPVTYPEHAAEGWPRDNEVLTEELWQGLVSRFLTGLQRAVASAGSGRLDEVVGDKTVLEHLESVAGHNAYH